METLISIKALTKQTGLTVRTLRYYDAIGLLKPSGTTTGGHRLYSEQDMLRLQQILFFKRIGFKLSEIKDLLEQHQWNWEEYLHKQLQSIREQRTHLDKMESTIRGMLFSLKVEGGIRWPIIFEMMQIGQQDIKKYWSFIEEYFEPHERELVYKLPGTNRDDIGVWIEVERNLRSVMHRDPADTVAQEVIEHFDNQIRAFVGNDEAFLEKLWQIRKDPALSSKMHFYPIDDQLIRFMDQALDIYYERKYPFFNMKEEK